MIRRWPRRPHVPKHIGRHGRRGQQVHVTDIVFNTPTNTFLDIVADNRLDFFLFVGVFHERNRIVNIFDLLLPQNRIILL